MQRSADEVRQYGKRLAELNVELAKAEIKRVAAKYGAAVGLFVAAGLFALFAFGFLWATIAAAIAVALPVWAALLIVTVLLFIVIGVLGLAGVRLLKAVKSPLPTQAIDEAQTTAGTVTRGLQRLRNRRPVVVPIIGADEVPAWPPAPETMVPPAPVTGADTAGAGGAGTSPDQEICRAELADEEGAHHA